MRLGLAMLVCATAAAGCATTPTDNPGCPTLGAQVNQLMASSVGCSADADCVCYAHTACGLRGECGEAVNGAASLQLDRLIAQWQLNCPNELSTCLDCSAPPMVPHCSDARCQCTFGP